jgi:hypothetical protein
MKLWIEQYLHIASIQKFDMNPFIIPFDVSVDNGSLAVAKIKPSSLLDVKNSPPRHRS